MASPNPAGQSGSTDQTGFPFSPPTPLEQAALRCVAAYLFRASNQVDTLGLGHRLAPGSGWRGAGGFDPATLAAFGDTLRGAALLCESFAVTEGAEGAERAEEKWHVGQSARLF